VVACVAAPGTCDAASLEAWGKEAIPGWRVEKGAAGTRVATARRGPLPGAGDWSHLFADAGNTACSQDAMAQGPVDLQWFGRPGPRRMVDRHDKNTAPLYRNGRLFVSGDNYLVAVDAYNGTVLWERDVPDSVRLGAFKNAGNMAASDDALYVASGSDCIGLDAATGRHRLTLSVPPAADGSDREWGYVAVADDLLVGSACRQGAAFRVQDIDTETLIWRDFMPVACSDSLLAHQRHTGKALWTYTPPEGVLINPTIAIGGGRVYCVESTNPETRRVPEGRVKLAMLLGQGANLVALNLHSGKVAWRRPAPLQDLQHVIFLSYAKDLLVITGTRNVPVDGKERVRYELRAFDAASGAPRWHTTQTPVPDHLLQGPHGEQVQHSAIVGDAIYNTGFACQLQTGEPIPGWKWQKSPTCGTLSTSASCAFSRYGSPRMFDLRTGQFTELTQVTRPGCWINILPAGGLILIPEASAGCTCGYSIQTSLALVPRQSHP
jgi:outer membrane protein assembly factor BamB